MTSPTTQITARLEVEDLETFDEIARRLDISRSHALRLGAHVLRLHTGLINDDAIRLVERAAQLGGDDAELVFTMRHVKRDETNIDVTTDVTVDGRPLPGVRPQLMFASAPLTQDPDENRILAPQEATIILHDDFTDANYTIGAIPFEDGAEISFPARELPLRIAGARLDDRTPEQRLSDTRMSLEILRAAGKLPED
jgi:Ribbon-helix-helix protein, copG family